MDGSISSVVSGAADVDSLALAYPGLKLLIQRATRDPDLAADLLNDAIVTSLDKLKSGEIADPSLLAGYIYRVALNHLRNHRRKQRGTFSAGDELAQMPDASKTGSNVRSIHESQLQKLVREVLTELPTPRDRELIVRFYLNEEEKETICADLGLSDAHFNRVIFRARERFKFLVERRGLGKADLVAVLLAFGMAAVGGMSP